MEGFVTDVQDTQVVSMMQSDLLQRAYSALDKPNNIIRTTLTPFNYIQPELNPLVCWTEDLSDVNIADLNHPVTHSIATTRELGLWQIYSKNVNTVPWRHFDTLECFCVFLCESHKFQHVLLEFWDKANLKFLCAFVFIPTESATLLGCVSTSFVWGMAFLLFLCKRAETQSDWEKNSWI